MTPGGPSVLTTTTLATTPAGNSHLSVSMGEPQTPAGAAAAAAAAEAAAASAAVRRKALDVMAVVLRGGLVAPWTAASSLFALATDPAPDIAEKAVQQLKQVGHGAACLLYSSVSAGTRGAEAGRTWDSLLS